MSLSSRWGNQSDCRESVWGKWGRETFRGESAIDIASVYDASSRHRRPTLCVDQLHHVNKFTEVPEAEAVPRETTAQRLGTASGRRKGKGPVTRALHLLPLMRLWEQHVCCQVVWGDRATKATLLHLTTYKSWRERKM
eukprot:1462738-Rhodomonas_salina.1